MLPAGADGGLAERLEAGFAGRQPGEIPGPHPGGATSRARALPGKHLGGFGTDGFSQRRLQGHGGRRPDRDRRGAGRDRDERQRRSHGAHVGHQFGHQCPARQDQCWRGVEPARAELVRGLGRQRRGFHGHQCDHQPVGSSGRCSPQRRTWSSRPSASST